MKRVLVSVIVPTYKRSEYIARALDSILAQTYQNYEIIIVDDNVPDSEYHKETKRTLTPYLEDKRIKYIKTSGALGGGATRNIGIAACTGDYVAFLDDDDRFLADKLEKQLKFMQENDLDMSYQDVRWHNEKDKLVELRKMDRVKDFSTEGLLKTHIVYPIAPTAIYMIKREALLRTEGFGDVKRGQDFILMLRCIEVGLKIGYMQGAYVVQYLHNGERISVGNHFISAQTEIYKIQKSYARILSKKECRYVDFRYNCVCAFACMRGKNVVTAIPYAVKSFIISPVECFKEAGRYFGSRVLGKLGILCFVKGINWGRS